MPPAKKSYTVSWPKMIGPVGKKPSIRIAGYLEKKGKMKLMMCRWKRWWFVLEGRLLLYYKSQLECLNLSPCRGSLNMGLAASVRPGKALELTVVTRSQTVTLRACNRRDHEQWLQSLVDAMALPNSALNFTTRPVMHFRYASQEHHENLIERIKSFRCPSYTVVTPNDNGPTSMQSGSCETSTSSSQSFSIDQSQSGKNILRRVLSDSHTLLRRPQRRSSVRNTFRLSKIALSDTAIPAATREVCLSPAHSSDKCQSMQELRHSPDDRGENLECETPVEKNLIDTERAIVVGSKDNNKLSNSIKIELNLEDTNPENGDSIKEQKIGNVKIVLDGCAIYGSKELNKEVEVNVNNCKTNGKVMQDYDDCLVRKRLNPQLPNSKEAKSDTDLTVRRKTRGQSISCENMQTLDRSIGSTFLDASSKIEVIGREERVNNLISESSQGLSSKKPGKKRSNSILSRFMDSKADKGGDSFERQGTIRKRLSFLRKVWKKREKKTEEEDYESIDYEPVPVVIELPNPEVTKAEDLLLSLERDSNCGPEPEPPPDYDISISEEIEIPPMLPPRQRIRPVSPWHDVPKNNKPVLPPEEDLPPPLPLKTKEKNPHQLVIKVNPDASSIETANVSMGGDSVLCEPPSTNGDHKLDELDTLLAQLSEVNTYVVRQIDVSQSLTGNIVQVSVAPEPDYDVPRPHLSLLATLRSQNVHSDTFTPTHFLCTTPLVDMDSLDPVISRLDAEMTPDSLECESPWSITHEFWPGQPDSTHSDSLLCHFITADDKLFPDSLNS